MVDRYTKAVLTVIAVSLAIIATKDVVPPAHAQMDGPVHVVVDSVASYALQYAGPLDVRVQQ